ncbi:MAG: Rpn family recombination-promoting nuclease/putative transposase [Firmicutes bacterium]|nr:Rpn family recombination-promoting nuclease/putative transposase [Bacillota bacterium]
MLFDGEAGWYNIEMQVAREDDLPQRGRYYSAAIDVAHLEKGRPYGELKQSFVIFICRFDYYGLCEAVYTFERFDKKLQLPYSDGSYTIMLNTKCSEEKVPEELRSLFHYINTEEAYGEDWFVDTIHEQVLRYQSDEEVARVATLEEEYMRKNILAEQKGRAEGAADRI